MQGILKEVLSDKMIVDLDVFGLFVEGIIMNNLNGTSNITVNRSSRRGGHTQIM